MDSNSNKLDVNKITEHKKHHAKTGSDLSVTSGIYWHTVSFTPELEHISAAELVHSTCVGGARVAHVEEFIRGCNLKQVLIHFVLDNFYKLEGAKDALICGNSSDSG